MLIWDFYKQILHSLNSTNTNNTIPTLKGVGVKGFVGKRQWNRPLTGCASYSHDGRHRYTAVPCVTAANKKKLVLK